MDPTFLQHPIPSLLGSQCISFCGPPGKAPQTSSGLYGSFTHSVTSISVVSRDPYQDQGLIVLDAILYIKRVKTVSALKNHINKSNTHLCFRVMGSCIGKKYRSVIARSPATKYKPYSEIF